MQYMGVTFSTYVLHIFWSSTIKVESTNTLKAGKIKESKERCLKDGKVQRRIQKRSYPVIALSKQCPAPLRLCFMPLSDNVSLNASLVYWLPLSL